MREACRYMPGSAAWSGSGDGHKEKRALFQKESAATPTDFSLTLDNGDRYHEGKRRPGYAAAPALELLSGPVDQDFFYAAS
jgi:hypothetical protein